MIRVRGVKIKEIVLNGRFDRLYGANCPANGMRNSLDIKVLGTPFYAQNHKAWCY